MNETLIERLRGTYRIPVNDGAGPLNGSNEFVRFFKPTPIMVEAADRIAELEAEVARLRDVANRYYDESDCVDMELDREMADALAGEPVGERK